MGMTDAQKLDFVLKMTKHALQHVQHFDSGGTVLTGATQGPTGTNISPGTQGIGGGVGNFLGTNNNFVGSSVPVNGGTNTAQLNDAYTRNTDALNHTLNLVGSVAPQANTAVASQNALTEQLRERAAGGGPNPAQAQLNQNTGQNINEAAALAASTRGAGANAGLVASNAARQAAATQQQAVGQSAALQAEQQIAAQNQLQGLAGQQIQQTSNAYQLGDQASQNEQNILQGANTAANNANVSQQENLNTVGATVSGGNQKANESVIGGIGNAIGAVGGFLGSLFAKGGKVEPHLMDTARIYHPHLFAQGGSTYEDSVPVSASINPGSAPSVDTSPVLPLFASSSSGKGSGGSPMDAADATELAGALAKGGVVGNKLKAGGKVPGKPKVGHDSYGNDTVSAKLSPGEVVIDLDTLKRKDKVGKMARFIASTIEKQKMGRSL